MAKSLSVKYEKCYILASDAYNNRCTVCTNALLVVHIYEDAWKPTVDIRTRGYYAGQFIVGVRMCHRRRVGCDDDSLIFGRASSRAKTTVVLTTGATTVIAPRKTTKTKRRTPSAKRELYVNGLYTERMCARRIIVFLVSFYVRAEIQWTRRAGNYSWDKVGSQRRRRQLTAGFLKRFIPYNIGLYTEMETVGWALRMCLLYVRT
jgi:hypothetical protein